MGLSSYLAAAVVPKRQVAEEAEQRKLGQATDTLGSSAFQALRGAEAEAERSGLASLGTTEVPGSFETSGSSRASSPSKASKASSLSKSSSSSETSNPFEGGNSIRALHGLEH